MSFIKAFLMTVPARFSADAFWCSRMRSRPMRSRTTGICCSRKNAYHGSTIAGSSLGGMEEMHKQGGVIPDIVHVEQPNWFARRCELGDDLDRDEFGRQAAQSIADKIEELGVERVANEKLRSRMPYRVASHLWEELPGPRWHLEM